MPLGSAGLAIDRFHEAWGVVEYVLVDSVAEPDPHAVAVAAAMSELERRWEAWVRSRIASQPSLRRSQFKTIASTPASATSTQISLDEFVGRGFDWHRSCLESLWEPGEAGGSHKIGSSDSGFLTGGYADAFAEPPYGLRVEMAQATAWFNSINLDLLGGLSEDLEIKSWSTDWSTWFDDGRDWWGAFFWTIRPIDRPWIAVIAASSTD